MTTGRTKAAFSARKITCTHALCGQPTKPKWEKFNGTHTHEHIHWHGNKIIQLNLDLLVAIFGCLISNVDFRTCKKQKITKGNNLNKCDWIQHRGTINQNGNKIKRDLCRKYRILWKFLRHNPKRSMSIIPTDRDESDTSLFVNWYAVFYVCLCVCVCACMHACVYLKTMIPPAMFR